MSFRKKEYQCWHGMKRRCLNEKCSQYKNYGGRGITICARWLESFNNFFADMGERPEGRSLDRIDNNGNYCKENCRWATDKQQRENQRRIHRFNIDGVVMTLTEVANAYGIHLATLHRRVVVNGMPIMDAVAIPVNQVKSRAGKIGCDSKWPAIAALTGSATP